jgi:hypothetical protein
MADPKLRLASLAVLGGALHGRRHDPDEVVAEILVGSDPDCHLVVDLPGISPIHARVWAGLDQAIVYDTHAPRGLWVNTTRVEKQSPVGEGDVLWLGSPQDPESVCVQLHFAPWVERLPPAVTGQEPSQGAPAAGVPIDQYEPVVLEAGPPRAEAPAAPPPPSPPPAASAPPAPPAEDDPFFVGGDAEPSVAPPPPLPTPEELVAQTVTDDWVIADAAPAPSAVPKPVVPAPAPTPAPDEFFVAEEPLPSAGQAPAVSKAEPVVVAPGAPASTPALELPSIEPVPAARAPSPVPPPAPAVTRAPAEPVPTPPTSPRPAPTPAPRAHPAPAGPPAAPRPQPTPVRRPVPSAAPRPGPARGRAPSSVRPARRPTRGTWVRPVAVGAAALAILGGIGFGVLRYLGGGVRLDAVEPGRLRVGQRATLAGSGFASRPGGNTVLFGDREARVLQASPTRLEVEVPDAVAESGGEKRVGVAVRTGRRTSNAVEVVVFQGPRLHGLSPEAAMPGEEVVLAGSGWGPGTTVRFGPAAARITEVQPTRIRAVVPEGAGSPGTAAPVVVTVGGVDSNPVPFIVGHLPVVSGVSPASAAPGDVVEVSGRGFQDDPLRNDVRVGGVPTLVLGAAGDALKVVVPRVGPGDPSRTLEVRVPGSEAVGQAALQVPPPADPVEFRFVAEPFTAVPGRPHAVLSTGLGPAFVLAGAGGRTAAARAVETASRLNAAAETLRNTVGLNLEARGLDASPVLALAGRSEVLLQVTAEDAAAYGEDWTGLRGRGGPVTPARLARWWEALGRDIVLLTVRGEPPRHAAALAPEGRVLGQLFDAARRSGRAGVPREVVDGARPPLRDGLRLLALRVPASVAAPAPAAPLAPVPAATPAPARLQLEGTWGGSQVEQGLRQYLTVVFRRSGGSISYEGGITLTVPLLTLEQPRRDQARFSVEMRGGIRHYVGTWDGEQLAGSVSTDAAGRNVVASFELRKR